MEKAKPSQMILSFMKENKPAIHKRMKRFIDPRDDHPFLASMVTHDPGAILKSHPYAGDGVEDYASGVHHAAMPDLHVSSHKVARRIKNGYEKLTDLLKSEKVQESFDRYPYSDPFEGMHNFTSLRRDVREGGEDARHALRVIPLVAATLEKARREKSSSLEALELFASSVAFTQVYLVAQKQERLAQTDEALPKHMKQLLRDNILMYAMGVFSRHGFGQLMEYFIAQKATQMVKS